MGRREETTRRARGRPAPARRKLGLPAKALIVVGLVLVVFTDDRHAGKIGDARQMIQTAVAITTTGELGVARGFERATVPRAEGDAVTRYGLGMCLAQVPAAFLAPGVEKRFGPGASQTLFVVAPLLLTLLAAAAAGRAARALGAGEKGAAIAVLLASLGSPLASYGTYDLSEPLQAASLAVAFAAALEASAAATRGAAIRASAVAGLAAGVAVLTKPNLIAVAPLALLPLLRLSRPGSETPARLRVGVAGLAALPGLVVWAASEVARFGGLFRGYGGESFSYPFLEGALRLLVGPNKGIVLFFPALVVALVELWRSCRSAAPVLRRSDPAGLAVLGPLAALLPLAALWATASPWWAWHGVAGWGPRLLVPGIPGAAALAGVAVERWKGRGARLLVGASVALNAPPLIQHSNPVSSYTATLQAVPATREVAMRFERSPDAVTGTMVAGGLLIHEVPAASDFVVWPWFFWTRTASDSAATARRLEQPPWSGSRPDLKPRALPYPPALAALLAPPPSVGFLGRSLLAGADPVKGEAYSQALSIQVLRAQQLRKLDRALALAEELDEINPKGDSDALLAESFRLLGRHELLRAHLDSLPRERRGSPPVLLVLALAARDVGENEPARAYLAAAARGFHDEALRELSERPPGFWPRDFSELYSRSDTDLTPSMPGVGQAVAPSPPGAPTTR